MVEEVFNQKMKEYAKEIGILLEEEQLHQFYIYMQLLLEWNKKINLTAIVEPEEIILKHFIDSITIAKEIEKNAKLIDVGTGAGFPGIPLKIIRKDLKITLLDSLNKRVCFLKKVVEELKLLKIETVHSRIEEFGKNKIYREKFDYATSRAVANLSTLSEYLIPMVKLNGCCVCMKGPNIEDELQQSKKAVLLLGGEIEKIEKFQLPKSNIERNVIIIRKVKNTPLKYPRKPGMATKEPIQ